MLVNGNRHTEERKQQEKGRDSFCHALLKRSPCIMLLSSLNLFGLSWKAHINHAHPPKTTVQKGWSAGHFRRTSAHLFKLSAQCWRDERVFSYPFFLLFFFLNCLFLAFYLLPNLGTNGPKEKIALWPATVIFYFFKLEEKGVRARLMLSKSRTLFKWSTLSRYIIHIINLLIIF